MFVHDTHLPQRLEPRHYASAEHLQRELESLFLGAWHCVGSATDLPHDGDYFTTDLLGRPILVWHKDGAFRAFLNVCPHRFSLLTERNRGCFARTLKCRYHGWEFGLDGQTCRIPDARSFRPLEKGEIGLTPFRVETTGQLIWVNLDDSAPPLADWLGRELYDTCGAWFSANHRQTVEVDYALDCDWKVVVENVLEAYHVESVHPKTFGGFPDPGRCRHEFYGEWDRFTDDYSSIGRLWQERFLSWLARAPTDRVWKHVLRYPHVVLGQMGLYTWVQMVLPVSPQRCRSISRLFHYPGPPGGLRTRLCHSIQKTAGSRFMRRVLAEDAAVYPGIQRGLAAAIQPKGGLISIREERIFAFQEKILQATEPLPPARGLHAEGGD